PILRYALDPGSCLPSIPPRPLLPVTPTVRQNLWSCSYLKPRDRTHLLMLFNDDKSLISPIPQCDQGTYAGFHDQNRGKMPFIHSPGQRTERTGSKTMSVKDTKIAIKRLLLSCGGVGRALEQRAVLVAPNEKEWNDRADRIWSIPTAPCEGGQRRS